MFTLDHPSPYATINSIEDNSAYGDERTFFDVKDQRDKKNAGFCDSTRVYDGQIVMFRAYVENSAADNLAAPNNTGTGVARKVQLHISADRTTSSLREITAVVAADNTKPPWVSDQLELAGPHPFRVDFVRGSARMYTNARPKGLALPDDLWESPEGTPLGYRDLDGVLVPGYQYAAIVTILARVSFVAND